MDKVKLNNGVLMPKFGLGTYKMTSYDHTYEVIQEALRLGYRHFDTAAMYLNEEVVGQAIRDFKIKRDEVFVTTKIVKLHNGNKDEIRKEIDGSLKRLNLEYIDLLLMHWPNQDYVVNSNAYSVFEEYYKKGKVRAIGLSNFKEHHIDNLLQNCKVKPQVNQIESHPLFNQETIHQYLISKGIQMIAYGPFAKGRVFSEPVASKINEIASNYNASISQVIISWQLARDIIMIPKTSTLERLSENLAGTSLVLSKTDLDKMNNMDENTRVYTDPDKNNFT